MHIVLFFSSTNLKLFVLVFPFGLKIEDWRFTVFSSLHQIQLCALCFKVVCSSHSKYVRLEKQRCSSCQNKATQNSGFNIMCPNEEAEILCTLLSAFKTTHDTRYIWLCAFTGKKEHRKYILQVCLLTCNGKVRQIGCFNVVLQDFEYCDCGAYLRDLFGSVHWSPVWSWAKHYFH